MFILLLSLINFFSVDTFAACVHEAQVKGSQLSNISEEFYIEVEPARYIRYQTPIHIDLEKTYNIQFVHDEDFSVEESLLDPHEQYNRRYVEYYTYARMQNFLRENSERWNHAGYDVSVVGQSLQGRQLFHLAPKVLDTKKKTILMFGRHHGDEGTANWIIEGFLQKFFGEEAQALRDKFQLVLFPMVNPDGTEKHTRYNIRGRDLNRSWGSTPEQSFDEVIPIHRKLNELLPMMGEVVISLDMHGSWDEDFIFRVSQNYKGLAFYNHQQEFIDMLASFDSWQAGNFIVSDGHPNMSRLILINDYGINALTHESIRNIPKFNSKGRDKASLMEQGVAVYEALARVY